MYNVGCVEAEDLDLKPLQPYHSLLSEALADEVGYEVPKLMEVDESQGQVKTNLVSVLVTI